MKIGMYGGKFLPFHLGHFSMITRASEMVDKLYVVLSYSVSRDSILSKNSGIKEMPFSIRLRWLVEATKDIPNVEVIAVQDTAESDETYDWKKGSLDIIDAINKPIDVIFGSEEHYRPIFKENYPNAEYICVDPDRTYFPISATKIRNEGIFKHWEFIPDVVKPHFTKKITIVGTESCGKSTLTKKLAEYFNTTFVEEFGRSYCNELGGSSGILFNEDFMNIAYGHKLSEYYQTKKANKLLFIDSEAVVTQYYSYLYGEGHIKNLEGIIHSQDYELILFLEPDVPWVQDGTRYHGEEKVRQKNNFLLKNLFEQYNVSYISIDGTYEERFKKSIDILQNPL
jgi:HTH-type transcriptional repressor of NAD biosynthesis genes